MAGPQPTDDKPPDWPPRQWRAYQAIQLRKASYAEAAAEAGVQPGTISRWVRLWRDRYGEGFCPPAHAPPRMDSHKGGYMMGKASRQRWADLREAAAGGLAETLDIGILLAQRVIRYHLRHPEDLSILDLKHLVDAIDRIARRADILAGIPDPNRALITQTNVLGSTPAGILDGLEAASIGDGDRDTLEAAERVIAHFLQDNEDGEDGDVIDIGETTDSGA